MATKDRTRKPKVVFIETSDTSSDSAVSSGGENSPPQIKKRGRPSKPKTNRKPRTANITDAAKTREDLNGIACRSCGINTRYVNRQMDTNKVGCLIARATCKCGAKKTRFIKKPDELPAITEMRTMFSWQARIL